MNVLVTGGTGSLGQAIVKCLLQLDHSVTVFSRDEEKQHRMRSCFGSNNLQFIIGDVRDYQSVRTALRHAEVVIHAAAMKQVPACEYFPTEAIRTNVGGAQNIIQAITEDRLPVRKVIGISTDKACHPSCVYGNTKALQEAILIHANLACPDTVFASVRLGNLIGSRGSVALLFREQVAGGGPVTITEPAMTRFWFGVDEAVGIVLLAMNKAGRGDIVIPKIQATSVGTLACVFIGDKPIQTKIIGIRPGEKMHETLISEEESLRASDEGDHFTLHPALTELSQPVCHISNPFTSDRVLMTDDELLGLLQRYELC